MELWTWKLKPSRNLRLKKNNKNNIPKWSQLGFKKVFEKDQSLEWLPLLKYLIVYDSDTLFWLYKGFFFENHNGEEITLETAENCSN